MYRFLTTVPLLILLMSSVSSSNPSDFSYWSASDLKRTADQLGPQINEQKFALEQMGRFANHYLLMLHRRGDGLAELHETETDFYVVQSGEATLVVGGQVVDPQETGPGEVRGPSIRNGETRQLRPGDVVNIPSRTPHQVLVQPGKSISYLIVKVRDR